MKIVLRMLRIDSSLSWLPASALVRFQRKARIPLVPLENDKPTVLALREIADGLVGPDILVEKPKEDFEPLAMELLSEAFDREPPAPEEF